MALSNIAEAGAERFLDHDAPRSKSLKQGCQMEHFLALLRGLPESSTCSVIGLVQHRVVYFAHNKTGCKVLGLIFQKSTADEAWRLVDELFGEVEEMAMHRYGARALVSMLTSMFQRHGCCDAVSALVSELLINFEDLLCHRFGHQVLQTLLTGPPSLQRQVLERLASQREGLLHTCNNEFGCRIVVAALTSNSDGVAKLLRVLSNFRPQSLTHSPCSVRVLETIARWRPVGHMLRFQLRGNLGHLLLTRRGRSFARHHGLLNIVHLPSPLGPAAWARSVKPAMLHRH